MITTFIVRHRIRIEGRGDRELAPDARVTKLILRIGDGRVELTAVVLQPNAFTVKLLDQPTRDRAHAGLLAAFGDAIVAVNGGYFDDHFDPVALCVINGREISPLSTRSPLSAVISINDRGQLNLVPTAWFSGGATSAIQAGPFVIDPGGTIGVTEAASARAKRTIIGQTNRGAIVVVSTSEASLSEMARILADAPRMIGCEAIDRAVNLDGGPSTTLLIRGQPLQSAGGPVRNYLLFSAKP